jgi:hypothetical protein
MRHKRRTRARDSVEKARRCGFRCGRHGVRVSRMGAWVLRFERDGQPQTETWSWIGRME